MKLYDQDGKIVVAIQDHGRGIGNEDLDRVMSRGFTKGKDKGTGLGLYYADLTIKSFGGALDIQSEKGAGTTVKLYLPIEAHPFINCRAEAIQN